MSLLNLYICSHQPKDFHLFCAEQMIYVIILDR
jgi:hypothetical protein